MFIKKLLVSVFVAIIGSALHLTGLLLGHHYFPNGVTIWTILAGPLAIGGIVYLVAVMMNRESEG